MITRRRTLILAFAVCAHTPFFRIQNNYILIGRVHHVDFYHDRNHCLPPTRAIVLALTMVSCSHGLKNIINTSCIDHSVTGNGIRGIHVL